MRILIYILMFFAVVLSACQDYESDINIKPAEPQLVLSAFLSPRDTITYVYLNQSTPTLGESDQDPFVRNATIILSDGSFSDTLSYDPFNNDSYFTYRTIESEKTYTITALYEGKKAMGTCTILPESPVDFKYTVDSIINKDQVKYIVYIEWTDSSINIAQTYYRTDVELQYIELGEIYNFGAQNLKPNKSNVQKGTGFNSKMNILYESTFIPRNSLKFLDFHLFMIDENYYKFELSDKGSMNGINTEPVRVYSNIKGGLGIVASYNNYALKNLFFQ